MAQGIPEKSLIDKTSNKSIKNNIKYIDIQNLCAKMNYKVMKQRKDVQIEIRRK